MPSAPPSPRPSAGARPRALRTELRPPLAGGPGPVGPCDAPTGEGGAAADPPAVVVVVDVLRMTTSAAVLAGAGVARLWVEADPDRARARARMHGARLFGERGMLPLPGFDDGNSPVALGRRRDLGGAGAVLCTTNGAAAVARGADAGTGAVPAVVLAAPINARAAAGAALACAAAADGERDLVLRCAGTEGRVSLDDVIGAGLVAEALLAGEPDLVPGDATLLALHAARGALAAAGGLAAALRACRHGRRLVAAGFDEDLRAAARRDAVTLAWLRTGGPEEPFRPWAAAADGPRARS